jgi:hypothetical protein
MTGDVTVKSSSSIFHLDLQLLCKLWIFLLERARYGIFNLSIRDRGSKLELILNLALGHRLSCLEKLTPSVF